MLFPPVPFLAKLKNGAKVLFKVERNITRQILNILLHFYLTVLHFKVFALI